KTMRRHPFHQGIRIDKGSKHPFWRCGEYTVKFDSTGHFFSHFLLFFGFSLLLLIDGYVWLWYDIRSGFSLHFPLLKNAQQHPEYFYIKNSCAQADSFNLILASE